MDPSFTYASPTPVRPRINSNPRADPANRTSNALRASVLDVALQLGIGNNSMVTDWMFNNSLQEVDEPEQGLTTSSNASEEPSSSSPLHNSSSSPQRQNSSSHIHQPIPQSATPFRTHIIHQKPELSISTEKELNDFKELLHSAGLSDMPSSAMPGGSEAGHSIKGPSSISFPDLTVPPRATTPKKLKKKRNDGGGKKKKKQSDGERAGYDTDASAATPSKSKSRFFRLGSKASKPDLQDTASTATASSSFSEDRKEPVPLPIAGRFATTLNVSNPPTASHFNLGASTPSPLSRAPSPIPPVLPPVTQPSLPTLNTSVSSTAPSAYVFSPTSAAPLSGTDRQHERESYTSAESVSTSSSTSKWRGFPFINNNTNNSNRESSSSSQNGHQLQSPTSPLPGQRQRSASTSPNAAGNGTFPTIALPHSHNGSSAELVTASPTSLASAKKRPTEDVLSPASPQQQYPWSNGGLRAPSPSPPTTSPQQPAASPISPSSQQQPTLSSRPSRTNLRQINTSHPPVAPLRPILTKRSASGGSAGSSGNEITLPPPNVLSFYDIPPPSPPPMGPLPSVPTSAPPAGPGPNAKIARQASGERVNGSNNMGGSGGGVGGGALMVQQPSVQRGRESPFPTRPVSPDRQNVTPAASTGFEARIRVPRYRELYAPMGAANVGPGSRATSPQPPPMSANMQVPSQGFARSTPVSPGLGRGALPSGMVSAAPAPSIISSAGATRAESAYDYGYGYSDDDAGEDELRGVLDRFAEGKGVRMSQEHEKEMGQAALGRRRSFEELQRMVSATSLNKEKDVPEDRSIISTTSSRDELDVVGYYAKAGLEERSVVSHNTSHTGGSGGVMGDDEDDDDRSYYPEDEMAGRRTVYYEEELENLPPVPPLPNSTNLRTTGSGPRVNTSNGKYASRASQWSKWSESVYSRASIMDGEKSGVTREQFLQRINDMYDENGREKDSVPSSSRYRTRESEERDKEWEKIQATLFSSRNGATGAHRDRSAASPPPVPKIPESAKNWNRF
ncbi:hypothetical protein AX16_007412 [Volvariella volvacea WC 439]|nr:hypothetical protein AX16_007412 [Volvariella volvacea WC 439]